MDDMWNVNPLGCEAAAVTLEQALERATSGFYGMSYAHEHEYLIAETDSVNMLLSSFHILDDTSVLNDLIYFDERRREMGPRSFSVVMNRGEELPHRHNFYELMYVLIGEIGERIDRELVRVSRGDVLIMNSNVCRADVVTSDCLVLYIPLTRTFLQEDLEQDSLSSELRGFLADSSPDRRYQKEYLHYMPGQSWGGGQVINQILNECVAHLPGCLSVIRGLTARLLHMLDKSEHLSERHYSASTSESVIMIKRIESSLADHGWNLDLTALAGEFHYSGAYLNRLFKSITGMTLQRYCVEQKLAVAHKMLCDSPLSINEIITSLGYRNRSYFYRAFKHRYGMTPQEVREEISLGH